jgi:hypothetical protein
MFKLSPLSLFLVSLFITQYGLTQARYEKPLKINIHQLKIEYIASNTILYINENVSPELFPNVYEAEIHCNFMDNIGDSIDWFMGNQYHEAELRVCSELIEKIVLSFNSSSHPNRKWRRKTCLILQDEYRFQLHHDLTKCQ